MMKTLWLTILLGACVAPAGAPEATTHDHYSYVETKIVEGRPAQQKPITTESEVSDEICSMLPDDGSCDGACDPAAFDAALPKGTCADAICTLTDGTVIRYGGCN